MASITTSNGSGITLPNWFLGAAAGAFITTSLLIIGVQIDMWAKTNDAVTKNAEQDVRLQRLEEAVYSTKTDIAAMKADIATTKDTTQRTSDKVDRLIDRELARDHGR